MISIIIPIYKAEKYLKECLDSIQKQSYPFYEAICVNDGSPDNSAAICQGFVDIDERFRLINQENGGVCAARNTGLAHARGELVCFVDSDDKVDVHYLRSLLAMHKRGWLPVCSYSTNDEKLGEIGMTKTYKANEYIHHILDEDIVHPNLWAMLFETKVIKNNNLEFVVGCIKNEDTEFFVKYISNIEHVIVTSYIGYYYRTNPDSCMHSEMDIRSLTSIEAQDRLSKYLLSKGVIADSDFVLGAAIQVYVYYAARSKKRALYDDVHERYDIKCFMRKMLKHPRLSRKLVSLCYLLFGRELFYKILSL